MESLIRFFWSARSAWDSTQKLEFATCHKMFQDVHHSTKLRKPNVNQKAYSQSEESARNTKSAFWRVMAHSKWQFALALTVKTSINKLWFATVRRFVSQDQVQSVVSLAYSLMTRNVKCTILVYKSRVILLNQHSNTRDWDAPQGLCLMKRLELATCLKTSPDVPIYICNWMQIFWISLIKCFQVYV